MVPTVYSGRKLLPERNKTKRNGVYDNARPWCRGNIDISDQDDSGEMLVMLRGMCTAVLPTEQKTPRFLALIVGCRIKEKNKESAFPVNSKKKAKWAVRILAD
jgi:hypothetical protein